MERIGIEMKWWEWKYIGIEEVEVIGYRRVDI